MKDKTIKNKEKIIFLIFVLVASSVLFTHIDKVCSTTGDLKTSGVTMLENGVDYVQQVHFDKESKLTDFSLMFGTYEKKNEGELIVQFFDSEKILVQEWVMDTAELTDNAYQMFHFEEPYTAAKESSGYILIRESYKEDNALALYMFSQETTADIAYVGKTPIDKQAICYKLYYSDSEFKRDIMIACGVVLLIFTILILSGINETAIMICILITLGITYMWALPLGEVADEGNHFYRAFEISCGCWKSAHINASGEGGRVLPAALLSYSDNSAILDWNNMKEISLFNTAVYAPVSYLPQAFAIKIARMFTQNVAKIFWAGRFGNYIVSLILSIWALKNIPVGKRIIFIIMIFPMTMQEMISMAPDSFTNSLSIAFIALMLSVSYKETDTIKKREICAIVLLGVLLSLCKIVYVVLIAMIFIIPQEKFSGKRQCRLFKFGIPALALILNFIWLRIASGYLIEVNSGVNSKEQVFFIINNIVRYYKIFIHTITQDITAWIQQMIGVSLAWNDIPITPIVWGLFLAMLFYEIFTCEIRFEQHKIDKVIFMFVVLGGIGLIGTSEYVSWTEVGKDVIVGIQGRYFTPLLPCLAFFAVWNNNITAKNEQKTKSEIRGYSLILSLILNGISVVDVLYHYV